MSGNTQELEEGSSIRMAIARPPAWGSVEPGEVPETFSIQTVKCVEDDDKILAIIDEVSSGKKISLDRMAHHERYIRSKYIALCQENGIHVCHDVYTRKSYTRYDYGQCTY